MRELNAAEFKAAAGGLLMPTGCAPQPKLMNPMESVAPRIAPSPWSWTGARVVGAWSTIPGLPPSNPWIY